MCVCMFVVCMRACACVRVLQLVRMPLSPLNPGFFFPLQVPSHFLDIVFTLAPQLQTLQFIRTLHPAPCTLHPAPCRYGFASSPGQSPAGAFPAAWSQVAEHVHTVSPGTMMLPGTCMCVPACIYMSMCICLCLYMRMCLYIFICMCLYICMCPRMCLFLRQRQRRCRCRCWCPCLCMYLCVYASAIIPSAMCIMPPLSAVSIFAPALSELYLVLLPPTHAGPDGCINPGEGGGGQYPVYNYVNNTNMCSYVPTLCSQPALPFSLPAYAPACCFP